MRPCCRATSQTCQRTVSGMRALLCATLLTPVEHPLNLLASRTKKAVGNTAVCGTAPLAQITVCLKWTNAALNNIKFIALLLSRPDSQSCSSHSVDTGNMRLNSKSSSPSALKQSTRCKGRGSIWGSWPHAEPQLFLLICHLHLLFSRLPRRKRWHGAQSHTRLLKGQYWFVSIWTSVCWETPSIRWLWKHDEEAT